MMYSKLLTIGAIYAALGMAAIAQAQQVVIVCLMAVCGQICHSQTPDGRALLEGVRFNSSALRQCDLLIRREQYVDGDVPEEIVSTTRLMMDKDNERLLMARRARKTKLANDDLTASVSQRAVWISGKQLVEFGSGRQFKKTCESFSAACAYGQVPSIERIGITEFPPLPRMNDGELEQDAWWSTKLRILGSVGRSRIGKLTTSVSYEAASGSKQGRSYVSTWEFDNNTLMPNSFAYTAVQQQETGEPLRQKFCDERHSWAELDGIYLPVSILTDELNSSSKEENSTTQLFWLSVNQHVEPPELTQVNDSTVIDALLSDSLVEGAVLGPARAISTR